MLASTGFLEDLALILGTAALVTVVFQRLKQPAVLGYLLAGLLVAPLVADKPTVGTLSEIGVTLLMFSIGLDFRFQKLVRLTTTSGAVMVIEVGLLAWLGYAATGWLGWDTRARLFGAGLCAISSTMIVAKVLDEANVEKRLKELAMSILIFEDLAAIALIAVLTAVANGVGVSTSRFVVGALELVAFLASILVVGSVLVPRFMRAVVRLGRKETALVAAVGLCFAMAILARRAGYSVALGAFLAGALTAESGEARFFERLIQPVRDMFTAIFFVSIGMLIEPHSALEHWPAVLALTAVVIVGKIVGVTSGAFLTGHGVHQSLRAALALAQLGEFSFIIATIGTEAHIGDGKLLPIAVSVSVLTSILTPWLVRYSEPIARFVDRRVPRRLQTFESLQRTWIDEHEDRRATDAKPRPTRRLIGLLCADVALLAVLIVSAAVFRDELADQLAGLLRISSRVGEIAVVVGAAVISTPFWIGILRASRKLGALMAEDAMPAAKPGQADFAAAPRRALIAAVQLLVFLAAGIALLAVTQPFLPSLPSAGVLLVMLAVVGAVFWRSATNLQGHVTAGAQVLVEVLKSGSSRRETANLTDVQSLLPGLGSFASVRIDAHSRMIGQRLDEFDLHGTTGCAVLAIARGGDGVLSPRGSERVQEGDVLALAGTPESLEVARKLLEEPEERRRAAH